MTVKKRGFASKSKAERQRIAQMGGRAAHLMGRAHEFSSEEAKVANILSKQKQKNETLV